MGGLKVTHSAEQRAMAKANGLALVTLACDGRAASRAGLIYQFGIAAESVTPFIKEMLALQKQYAVDMRTGKRRRRPRKGTTGHA